MYSIAVLALEKGQMNWRVVVCSDLNVERIRKASVSKRYFSVTREDLRGLIARLRASEKAVEHPTEENIQAWRQIAGK
jgi:hypothetical protein